MRVLELLERRRPNWQELERLCDRASGGTTTVYVPIAPNTTTLVAAAALTTASTVVAASQQGTGGFSAADVSRMGALYRAACADLALAYAYQLPQNTVQYLHRLVGRAHNQLYRSRRFEFNKWLHMLLFEVPKTIFHDRCVQIMFCVFWGLFILSAALAYSKIAWPDFAEQVLTVDGIHDLETMYENPIDGSNRSGDVDSTMAGLYIWNNT